MSARNLRIGVTIVRAWSALLPRGASVLDLGCGHGVPISRTLFEDGFDLFGVDASETLIGAFRERFPTAQAECSSVEESGFFSRTFDGAVAWGLLFLLPAGLQQVVIRKVAGTLNRNGRFLFTAPREAVSWTDALTGRESVSLGLDAYRKILDDAGLLLVGEQRDEGDNHYYFALKP